MLDALFLSISMGAGVRFRTGRDSLEAIGNGWFVSLDATLPSPRANIMVTSVESQGSASPVKVGSVIPLSAGEIELAT